jgi:hypothetical protein
MVCRNHNLKRNNQEAKLEAPPYHDFHHVKGYTLIAAFLENVRK